MLHIPVLREELIEYLDPQPGDNFIDGTLGAAGHALAILDKTSPDGRLMGFDWDAESLARTKNKVLEESKDLAARIIFINDSYANLKEQVLKNDFNPVAGIVVDLGLSSDQLENSGRGFSFLKDEALDMRYSLEQELTAREILNHWGEQEIEKVLKEYGEEPFARRVAEEIVKNRKIRSILNTSELVAIVAKAIPQKFQHARIHFATRVFQALRIATNDELGNLQRFLPQALDVLVVGGKLAVISFHSLEDRIVKNFFRDQAKNGQVEVLTKKPITAQELEISSNPRSRSAKMRVIKKII
ncbi:MAG TPA: 16S rRNA (cytosine(1402)-N(4))-methyltransferase RsmH [Candidatus Portnoybacteria bacterium]|nr:16S rRNA (cytosine(1402)-N(4))-methyltransferase RsmH [Candidatus Portnoybacteria bacterium]